MNYCSIKEFDIADGPGVRVSLFVSGCTHHCRGCFQPETWDFGYGMPYTDQVTEKIIGLLDNDNIQGLTLLGGEPFEPVNQRGLIGLLRAVKDKCPKKDIWCYTGYTYERDLAPGAPLEDEPSRRCPDSERVPGNGMGVRTDVTDEMLSDIDVLVDGEFIEEERDLMLMFRGSRNQRLLKLKDGTPQGLYDEK